MKNHAADSWDSRREKDIQAALVDLKALDESGYFDGLVKSDLSKKNLKSQLQIQELIQRAAPFIRRAAQFKPLDMPLTPALEQFMTQLAVHERAKIYKVENQEKFLAAVWQVRILFGKIARREISSNSVIRSIVGSFMDTFMKDRNLILNFVMAPHNEEDYLYDHSLKLCLVSLSLASAMGYSRAQSLEVAQGALLSDVGMMLVPESIRFKRGKLSESEMHEIQKHPKLSLTLLEHVHGLSEASLIIPYQHHERLTGSGYPDKRAGNTVSKFSRIVAIADVFTALISTRSYRESLVPYQAMVSLLAMCGKGLLDGDQVKYLLGAMSIFPLGSLVRLSSGRIGKVVGPNPSEFTKPLVSVLTSEMGAPLLESDIFQIDIATSGEKIVEALHGHAIRHSLLDGF